MTECYKIKGTVEEREKGGKGKEKSLVLTGSGRKNEWCGYSKFFIFKENFITH